MFKWLAVGLAMLLPYALQAQVAASPSQDDPCMQKFVGPATPDAPTGKKDKKKKKEPEDTLVPLGLVVCEVETALDKYQQSPDVTDGTKKEVLPHILSADFDFKTVVDTKGTAGIGFYIFKIGGSYDKQTTNDVDFQYVPKSLVKGPGKSVSLATVSFQDELLKTIRSAAKAIKDEQAKPVPISEKDPLVFKQLSVTVSFGVTWDVN